VGHFSEDVNAFAVAGVDNPPLHLLTDGVSGANGVYLYTPTSAFPSHGWLSSNFWVDVAFTPAVALPPSVLTTSLPSGVNGIAYSATLGSSGAAPYTWSVASGALPAGLTLNAATGVISGTPTGTGTSSFTVQVTDANGLSATRALSVTVVASSSVSIWPSTAVPTVADCGVNGVGAELGVKFRTDVNGYVTGIRFYKAVANNGTHIGNLWTSTGTLLATAIFTSETGSGWQQVTFPAPVAVIANTVYVASYHTDVGHFSEDVNAFAVAGVDNPPLHLLTDGVSGANGVYLYTPTSAFPSHGWLSSNFWVDVAFTPG
jgi:hypothetical protein